MQVFIGWIESFDHFCTFVATFSITYLDNGLPSNSSLESNQLGWSNFLDSSPSLEQLVYFAITSQAFIFLATWSPMGPMGLVKGFCLDVLHFTPCRF
jgi:hypothetical protein